MSSRYACGAGSVAHLMVADIQLLAICQGVIAPARGALCFDCCTERCALDTSECIAKFDHSHRLPQDQQRLKHEADKARQLAAEQGDELASARERMEQMKEELKGVKDTVREQLLELEQLKTVQRWPIISASCHVLRFCCPSIQTCYSV